jgi:tetratricopeptide (TPR) repeat protein
MPARRRRLAIVVLMLLLTHGTGSRAQEAAARAKDAYARAIELEARGNFPAALSLLWEAAGLAPRDADVQNRLGEALDRMGALDAAIDAYRRAVSERPDFRKAVNNLVLTLVKAGRGPEAVARARAFVAQGPDDPSRHFTLGLAQSEQDVDQAIGSFRRALELDPRHTLARYNLALVLKRADRLPEAIATLQRALEIEPRAEAHYTLGVIYWQQGDLDRAANALSAAVAAGPQYADAHYTLGAVRAARGDAAGAVESLRRALVLRPDLTGAHDTLARVLQRSGDDAGGRKHFAEADRLRRRAQLEQEASVLTALGTQKLEAGNLTGALEQFRRATAAFEAYAPAYYQMGRTLQRLGEIEASRAAFARAAELNPSLVSLRDTPSPK